MNLIKIEVSVLLGISTYSLMRTKGSTIFNKVPLKSIHSIHREGNTRYSFTKKDLNEYTTFETFRKEYKITSENSRTTNFTQYYIYVNLNCNDQDILGCFTFPAPEKLIKEYLQTGRLDIRDNNINKILSDNNE